MEDNHVTKEYLDAALESLKQELMEFTRGLQTEMLRGFEGYALGRRDPAS